MLRNCGKKEMKKTKIVQEPSLIKKNALSSNDFLSMVLLFLYLLIDFVPQYECYNYAEPQWLCVNFINITILLYFIFSKKIVSSTNLKFFFKNKIIILYLVFLAISGISILVSFNFDESIIALTRYIVTFIAFFNLYFLLKNKSHLLFEISILISFVLFIECWKGLSIFFGNLGKINIEILRAMMTTNHANKNIFAANVLVKIPFVMFAIVTEKTWKKIIFIVILCTAFLTVYFLSARAITLGLFLTVFIISIGFLYFYIKNKQIQKGSVSILTAALGLIAVFYLSIYIIKKNNYEIDKNGDKIQIENGAENRLKNIGNGTASLKIRLHYWQSSKEVITKNPVLGCGLGSWKIESMPFENKWKNNNSNGIHMHNDFLEVAAETGVLNGLIYISIFLTIMFLNIKTFLRSNSENQQLFSLMLFGSIVGYTVDSFFNFPLSQPTMQIIFVVVLVLTILNTSTKNPENSSLSRSSIVFSIVLLVVSVITVYPNYLMFEFYKSINITKIDNVALNLSFAQVDALFKKFPSLDDTASPVNDIKTRYLIKENKFSDALKSIVISNKINPYSLYSNSLRVEMYDKMKQYDSVLKYNKILFKTQPSYPLFYERYIISLARKKDTAAIQKTFRDLNPEFKNAKHFAYTFSYLLNAGLAPKNSYKIIEKGLFQFPNDSLLLDIKKDFSRMLEVTGQKNNDDSNSKPLDFNKALVFYLSEYKKNSNNFVNTENVGVCYYQQKKYDLAISYLQKVVDSKAFANGKSEYIIALCYYYKNDFKKSCTFATKSANLNYPDAAQLQKMSCK